MQVQSLGWEDPWSRKWQPTPVFLPGNPTDRGAWWATVQGLLRVIQDSVTIQQNILLTPFVDKDIEVHHSVQSLSRVRLFATP